MSETAIHPSAVSGDNGAPRSERERWAPLLVLPSWKDPRWAFGALLTLYGILGFTVFGFNRSPWQMLFIVVSGSALEVLYSRVVRGVAVFPLSAWISCCSLAILLNYSHGSLLPFLPVLLCIGGKHILTTKGRHVFNPSMFAVAVALLIGRELITAAPAYQWDGNAITVTFFLVAAGMAMFVFRVGRTWLIVSFLLFYAAQTAVRAVIMRHHLPPEMLFIGTMTTPPFFLFTMYMLTDPGTSPKTPKGQVLVAFLVASIDLVFHAKESVFTFFYAALTVAAGRFLLSQWQRGRALGVSAWVKEELFAPARLKAVALTLVITAAYAGAWHAQASPPGTHPVTFKTVAVPASESGLDVEMGNLLDQVDPRLLHVAKWVMSVGDAVAVGDVDGDGRLDLFLTHALKRDEDRAAIYLNRSDATGLRFERLPVPVLADLAGNYRTDGVAAGGAFADYDNDGDDDLLVSVAFGKTRLLKNLRVETGSPGFVDVSKVVGLTQHTVSLGGLFFDVDNDGDLDLMVLNATTPLLEGYERPTPLNIFALPPMKDASDRRALRFMHNGWHDADNGGMNQLYLNEPMGSDVVVEDVIPNAGSTRRFVHQDNVAWGITDTRWSLAAVTVDFNHDGFTDIYVANDFGPDDLYFNVGGKRFEHHKGGTLFNTVGNDTYKGMNASSADFDRNGYVDVYISNVHHALQAEGSLLWMVRPSDDPFRPDFADEATARGALNERRFAWGAAAGDLNLDGYADIVQANGMVDDRLDPLIPDGERKDYWYINHKLMQSGPEIHTYADMWGDIRGRTIYPNEARRALLNLGSEGREKRGHFVDVAEEIGLAAPDNSRGVLLFDADGDGDLDVVIANQHGPTSLYRNTLRDNPALPATPHFVCIRPIGDGVTVPRTAIGTAMRTTVDGEERLEELTLMGGFSAQREPFLRIGLGSDVAGPTQAVSIRFTDGTVREMKVPLDRCVDVLRAPSAPSVPSVPSVMTP